MKLTPCSGLLTCGLIFTLTMSGCVSTTEKTEYPADWTPLQSGGGASPDSCLDISGVYTDAYKACRHPGTCSLSAVLYMGAKGEHPLGTETVTIRQPSSSIISISTPSGWGFQLDSNEQQFRCSDGVISLKSGYWQNYGDSYDQIRYELHRDEDHGLVLKAKEERGYSALIITLVEKTEIWARWEYLGEPVALEPVSESAVAPHREFEKVSGSIKMPADKEAYFRSGVLQPGEVILYYGPQEKTFEMTYLLRSRDDGFLFTDRGIYLLEEHTNNAGRRSSNPGPISFWEYSDVKSLQWKTVAGGFQIYIRFKEGSGMQWAPTSLTVVVPTYFTRSKVLNILKERVSPDALAQD